MTPQFGAAFVRAFYGAALTAALTFLTTYQTTGDATGAGIAAGVAGLTYLSARGVAEGLIDSNRGPTPADVGYGQPIAIRPNVYDPDGDGVPNP